MNFFGCFSMVVDKLLVGQARVCRILGGRGTLLQCFVLQRENIQRFWTSVLVALVGVFAKGKCCQAGVVKSNFTKTEVRFFFFFCFY